MIAISKYNKQHPLRVFEAFAGSKMKHRTPRTDGLSNTITSFFTDNLVLIVKEI